MAGRTPQNKGSVNKLPKEQIRLIAEWLFITTMADLRSRCTQVEPIDRYATLGVAPLLRKLLVDSPALVDRDHGSDMPKPTFEIVKVPLSPNADMVQDGRLWKGHLTAAAETLLPGVGPMPGRPQVGPTLSLNRESLLKQEIGAAGDTYFTVRELINHCANVEGGVHLGQPKNKTERMFMLTLAPSLQVGWQPGTLELLRVVLVVGAIVLRGLNPLEAAVRARPTQLPGQWFFEQGGFDNRQPWQDIWAQVGV